MDLNTTNNGMQFTSPYSLASSPSSRSSSSSTTRTCPRCPHRLSDLASHFEMIAVDTTMTNTQPLPTNHSRVQTFSSWGNNQDMESQRKIEEHDVQLRGEIATDTASPACEYQTRRTFQLPDTGHQSALIASAEETGQLGSAVTVFSLKRKGSFGCNEPIRRTKANF